MPLHREREALMRELKRHVYEELLEDLRASDPVPFDNAVDNTFVIGEVPDRTVPAIPPGMVPLVAILLSIPMLVHGRSRDRVNGVRASCRPTEMR